MSEKLENNIPIFRAKKIDSDEWVIGQINKAYDWMDENGDELEEPLEKYFIIQCLDNQYSDVDMWYFLGFAEIDPTTLSIHFPDMIASDSDRLLPNGEKDLRIFASLQEDGRGGDEALYDDKMKCISIYLENCFGWLNVKELEISKRYPISFLRLKPLEKIKITGIKQ